jgi:serine/threonine protein kinase
MLSSLTLQNHKHLVKLLATYKLQSKYHLLFPYAKANLRSYWDGVSMPYWNQNTCIWILRQISGLTSGLNVIHNLRTSRPFESDTQSAGITSQNPSLAVPLSVDPAEDTYGRHGDLKPENILWSNELEGGGPEGILLIADLGLGRFHRLESRSRVDPTERNGSPTYTPPEVPLGELISRAYDIWSLGCIFLEFTTWMLEGTQGLKDFTIARGAIAYDGIYDDTFFTVIVSSTQRYAVVRSGVTTWVARLRGNPRCSKMVNDLLDLVQQQMLIINSKNRIKAKDLDSNLRRILTEAEMDSDYLLGENHSARNTDTGIKPSQTTDGNFMPQLRALPIQVDGSNLTG